MIAPKNITSVIPKSTVIPSSRISPHLLPRPIGSPHRQLVRPAREKLILIVQYLSKCSRQKRPARRNIHARCKVLDELVSLDVIHASPKIIVPSAEPVSPTE